MNAGLDPPETNCGGGGRQGQQQPPKQGNSMEGITQDVAIQTKMKFLRITFYEVKYSQVLVLVFLGNIENCSNYSDKAGCGVLLLKLTNGGGGSSVHLHLCYKCLIQSSW